VLVLLGRHGPLFLVLSLILGTVLPAPAAFAHSILPVSAFLLTLGSFLTAVLAPNSDKVSLRLATITVLWAGIGLPWLLTCVLKLTDVGLETRTGVILSALAPPVGSAAAIAAMLGLQPRLALTASIFLTILAPVTMPFTAKLLGSDITFDTYLIAKRLMIIIGSAGAIAAMAIRWRKWTTWILPNQGAAAGVAVIGLVVVGLATADGIRAAWNLNPSVFIKYALAAFIVNAACTFSTTCLFAFSGLRNAGTIGLLSGNRNVTLAWAAAGSSLSSFTEAYIAACVIPILSLPLVIKVSSALFRTIRTRSPHARPPRLR
jgi:arsenite transporter